MATRVYKEQDITLQDGVEVTLRPLPIARLRRFMNAWNEFSKAEDEDAGFTVFINCAGIALEENFTDKFEVKASAQEQKKGNFLGPDYRDYLENVLELDTIYKILEVCGGIILQTPKEMEGLAETLETE